MKTKIFQKTGLKKLPDDENDKIEKLQREFKDEINRLQNGLPTENNEVNVSPKKSKLFPVTALII